MYAEWNLNLFEVCFLHCGVGLKLALATQKWQNLHCSQELTLPAEQSNYSGYITPVWDSVCERIWWGLTDGIVFRSVWQSNTGKHVHEINQILTICNVYFLGLAVIIQKGWMSKSHTVLSSHCLRNTKKITTKNSKNEIKQQINLHYFCCVYWFMTESISANKPKWIPCES